LPGAVGRATNATLTDTRLAKIIAAAAYWFTSSTSFANPAVTVGRALSDTFAGIAPASVPAFVAAQLLGALAGAGLLVLLFGCRVPPGEDVVMPHPDRLDNSHDGPDPHDELAAGPQLERSPAR
jgi:hypothetical protein